jgi:hypothetical protein
MASGVVVLTSRNAQSGALRKICSLSLWTGIGRGGASLPPRVTPQGLSRRHCPYKLQMLRNAPVLSLLAQALPSPAA